MNNKHHTPRRAPTARCRSFAALLPLLDEPGVAAEAVAEARAHLATCAYCQTQRAAYRQLEVAARRYLSPPASPRYRTEDIMSSLNENIKSIIAPRSEQSAPSAPPVVPAAPRRQSRRLFGVLSALAAVLLIGVIVGATLLARGRVPGGAPAQGTPMPPSQHISDSGFADLSMVSPSEGWAVGGSYTADYEHSSNPTTLSVDVLLWHYLNGTWSPVQLPLHGQLQSISMDSPTDGWAIGENRYDHTQDRFLLLHYDGQSWKPVSSQTIQAMLLYAGILNQVQMLSASDGWVVGAVEFGPGSTRSGIWHYDGQTWYAEPLPTGLSQQSSQERDTLQVISISMISASEGWAAATLTPAVVVPASPTPMPASPLDVSPSGVILHYTGGRWEVQRVISHARLFSISMLSATDGWIAGQEATEIDVLDPTTSSVSVPQQTAAPLLLHYTQGQWGDATSRLNVQASKLDSLRWVSMRSANDGWLLFNPKGKYTFPSTLLRYNGSQWNSVSLPTIKNTSSLSISHVSMISPTEGWAVGKRTVKSSPGYDLLSVPIILHYLNGSWTVYNS